MTTELFNKVEKLIESNHPLTWQVAKKHQLDFDTIQNTMHFRRLVANELQRMQLRKNYEHSPSNKTQQG